jgi:histone H3/H4
MSKARTRSLVNRSALRQLVRERGKNAAADLPEHLSERIVLLVEAAVRRAEGNGRVTVRGVDL